MDIRFTCDKCGQRLMIDEPAAGLTIPCPACGASLTVPNVLSESPAPVVALNYQELYSQSRNLAYELRVDEAISVWKQAEETRARERGYQLSEAFRFNDSAQNVLEQARWTVKQSLRQMTEKEETEIIGALVWQALSGSSYSASSKEVYALVIGSNLNWPAFEEWFRRFKELHTWPSMWEIDGNGETSTSQAEMVDFFENELAKPTDPDLARAHALSLSSRRLLFGRLARLTPDTLREGGMQLETTISELLLAGFARRRDPASTEKRLESLSLKWLQDLQKKCGLVVPRAKKGEAPKDYAEKRQRIVQLLVSAISVEKLVGELPPEEVFELTTPDVPRAGFEEFRADILTSTLSGMMTSYRWFSQIADVMRNDDGYSKRVKVKAILTDDCPFCIEASKRLENATSVTLEMLPPFHPGCHCCPGVFERNSIGT